MDPGTITFLNFETFFLKAILIWNDLQGKVPDSIISTLPKEKLFIVRPGNNSLQNRYLPMDLIRTDAIVNLDDDVRISNSDYALGFRQDLIKYLKYYLN